MIKRFRSAISGRFIKRALAALSPGTTIGEHKVARCGQKPVAIDDRPDWFARLAGEHSAALASNRRKPMLDITVTVKAVDLQAALGELNSHWGGCFPDSGDVR